MRTWPNSLLLLLIMMLQAHSSIAYYYKAYTTTQGLISNNVYHSLRDSKGYLWFFTDKGVSKFDGATFKNFTVADSLSDQDVFSGYEDKQGRLWLYTFNGAPCFIKNGRVYNAGNDKLLKQLPVISYMEYILEDNDSMYIGYVNGMVIKAGKYGFKWVINAQRQYRELYSMNKAGDSVQINTGYAIMSLVKDLVVRIDPLPININFHDYDKLLYLDDKGMKIYNGRRLDWYYEDSYLNKANVRHVYCDKYGRVFYSTMNGLAIVDKNRNKASLLDNVKVSSVNQDIYGNYWVTTLGNGIFYLNKNLDAIEPIDKIAHSKTYVAGNKQVFFCSGTSVYHFDGAEQMPAIADIAPESVPLYIDSDFFFFAYGDSTCCKDRHSQKVAGAFQLAKSIYPTGKGSFLLVGLHYVALVHQQKLRLIADTLILMPRIHQSCFDGRTLYFSCNKAIYSFDIMAKTITLTDSLGPYQSVSRLYIFDGRLIVTTNGPIAIFYDLGAHNKKEVKAYPFTCYDISRIDTSGRKYLLNTDKGYYTTDDLTDRQTGRELLEYPIATTDVLSVNMVNSRAICNVDGIYYTFDAQLINKEKRRPDFFIERVYVNGKERPTTSLDIKNSRHTHLSILLSSLKFDHVAAGFEYRIIRNDTSQWFKTVSEQPDIFLEGSGSYIIELRALTDNRIASASRYLALTISPPFYSSFNFYALLFIAVATVIVFAIKRYDRYKVKLFQKELNYMQMEYRSVNSLLNPHFVFNAINNIQNLININSKDSANNYLVILSRLMRQNMENLQLSFIPLSKELDLTRNYIKLQNLRFDNRILLTIEDKTGRADDIQIPPLLIHTFVENSIVHGFRKKTDHFSITVNLDGTDDDMLVIKVSDNGIGLSAGRQEPPVTEKRSMGIESVRKRLSRLSNIYKVSHTVVVEDAAGGGTEVTVIIYSRFRNSREAYAG